MNEDWRQGFTLEHLKRLAEPFKKAFGPHTYGAFGVPKERDVANALVKRRFAWLEDEHGVSAAAIWSQSEQNTRQTTFTGDAVLIPAGDLVVQDVAALGDGQEAVVMLRSLFHARKAPAHWVEMHEEIAQREVIARELELIWAASKITAGGEVKGLYVGGPAAQLRLPKPPSLADEGTLLCLEDEFLSPKVHGKIIGELATYEQRHVWAQHYSSYNKRHSWTAFALRGYDATDPGFIIKPGEMSQKWREGNPGRLAAESKWTTAAPEFPMTLEVVRDLAPAVDRVRFMRLTGEGELTRHADITDRTAGTRDGQVARLHIPIRSHEQVRFQAWSHRGVRIERTPHERALYYLDMRKPHAVQNQDPVRDRIHLVVDVVVDATLRLTIEKAVASGC
jgi:hypothetical protein